MTAMIMLVGTNHIFRVLSPIVFELFNKVYIGEHYALVVLEIPITIRFFSKHL